MSQAFEKLWEEEDRSGTTLILKAALKNLARKFYNLGYLQCYEDIEGK